MFVVLAISNVPIGQVEYESRTAAITAGIVLSILLPVILCVAGGIYFVMKNNDNKPPSWVFDQPRSRSNSRLRLSEPTFDSRQISPEFSPEQSPTTRVTSPISDISAISTSGKKKRNYDGVYRTNEPLQNAPDVEWEEKDWDILSSTAGSEYDPGTNNKPNRARMYSDPEYMYPEEDEEELPINRTGTMDSGLGGDHIEHRPKSVFVSRKASDHYEKPDQELTKSQPILNYTSDDYAQVTKPAKTNKIQKQQSVSSMSSRITAV